MLGDKLLACHVVVLGTRSGECGAPQPSTEVQVDDKTQLGEVVWGTLLRLQVEVRIRRAPRVWRRPALPNISGLRACGPEPCADISRFGAQFAGVGATAPSVEACTNGVLRALLGTSLILPLVLRLPVAVCRRSAVGARGPRATEVLALAHIHLTTGALLLVCVEARYDLAHPVRPLDDVILACLASHVEGRPGAATRRHVVDGEDKKALVVLRSRLDAH
mmetsp:Transcript_31445/g.70802  ORF Transcript_31445/g.70802 Transcript_31445/m.70802 type:complete len:220 (-) Transcript_31445:393-1052(-)